MDASKLWAVVMAGGHGTRFWPLSRPDLPKQCLDLGEGGSLLQQSIRRLLPLIPIDRILVVTGESMLAPVQRQVAELGLAAENLLVEPSPRNTAPCIAWGTVEVARRAGEHAALVVVPSDQVIDDQEIFLQTLQAASRVAQVQDAIVTIGVQPDRPATGYGYLELGDGVCNGEARRVLRFTEKPSESLATQWIAAGTHVWNAGIFLFPAAVMLRAFRRYLPDSAAVLDELYREPACLPSLWEQLERISIDYGIMERCEGLLSVAADFGWSDVGTWQSAGAMLPVLDESGTHGRVASLVALDAENCVVYSPNKTVALVGVQNLVVVDTHDAVLIMTREREQDVRTIVESLRAGDQAPVDGFEE